MIFADKLIKLRRQKGWSQEELAERMSVTRQSVSKWESMQSLPDIDRILQLSELFGVSTDYLLKDEVEEVQIHEEKENDSRYVTAQEAEDFIQAKRKIALPFSIGVFLCIISPICLLMLAAFSDNNIKNYISENMAGGTGIIALLVFVAVAVGIFIFCGSKTSQYQYMEKEILNVDSNAVKKARSEKENFSKAYTLNTIMGVIICVLGAVPLFAGAVINGDNVIIVVACLCISIFIVAVGVMLLTRVNTINNAFNMLLQEGDYSKDKKRRNTLVSAICVTYWLSAVAIFLLWSFLTNKWNLTWLVFAVAGVLFPAVLSVVEHISRKK
ncbi:MAG: helix-turn-helix transcriptional regulator [Clostridiales bacterium]|nr:helix-turn-helix transcriptional regulator [Clostridiales bacterium]